MKNETFSIEFRLNKSVIIIESKMDDKRGAVHVQGKMIWRFLIGVACVLILTSCITQPLGVIPKEPPNNPPIEPNEPNETDGANDAVE